MPSKRGRTKFRRSLLDQRDREEERRRRDPHGRLHTGSLTGPYYCCETERPGRHWPHSCAHCWPAD